MLGTNNLNQKSIVLIKALRPTAGDNTEKPYGRYQTFLKNAQKLFGKHRLAFSDQTFTLIHFLHDIRKKTERTNEPSNN